MSSNIEKAIEIFEAHMGILRSSEAQKLGIHPQIINRMVERGLLTKEERGLYRLASKEIETDPDLINVTKLVPKAVFCLLTALSFHEMTQQIPRKVYVALPFGYREPDISHPPLEIVNLSKKPYKAGIERHNLSGVSVPIYNEAKTVTDCFKFRRKIGENVAIEALKEYVRRDNHDIQLLLEYAKINRVKNVIEPYLKVLI
jgi:predicted transcriptional regulator of viral defense system